MIESLLQVTGFGHDGWDTGSRFGHFPTSYTRDYDVSFLWVLFIMLMVIAVALYILSVMDKRPPE